MLFRSQVSRRSEVGNTKLRSLNTHLCSGTSAGTFAVSAGPYINYCTETRRVPGLWPDHLVNSVLTKNVSHVRFSEVLGHGNSCKGPRTLRKFPQKCQKIAGCSKCAAYGSRPPIASSPGSSPPERPCLDNITS